MLETTDSIAAPRANGAFVAQKRIPRKVARATKLTIAVIRKTSSGLSRISRAVVEGGCDVKLGAATALMEGLFLSLEAMLAGGLIIGNKEWKQKSDSFVTHQRSVPLEDCYS